MLDHYFIDVAMAQKKVKQADLEGVTDQDLKKINSLNRNGPLRELKKEDINTRSIIILGEEPTTKMSIHPEGERNGKSVKTLSQISKLLPGAPMMIGHRMDKAPWGRTFSAEVMPKMAGYSGAVLHNKYWFLNDEEGNGIARKIDGGIWSEGSISYWFKEMRCSICHKPMMRSLFGAHSRCGHKVGEKDPETGQICYWYPHVIKKVAETSYVFAGAYTKTKSMLTADRKELQECYSDPEIEAGLQLEETLKEYGLDPDTMDISNLNESEAHDAEEKQESDDGDHSTDSKLVLSSADSAEGTTDSAEENGGSTEPNGEENGEGESTENQDQGTAGDREEEERSSENNDSETEVENSEGDSEGEENASSEGEEVEPEGNDSEENGSETEAEGEEVNEDSQKEGEGERNANAQESQTPDNSTEPGSGTDRQEHTESDNLAEECECPKCGHKQKPDKDKSCSETKCAKCDAEMNSCDIHNSAAQDEQESDGTPGEENEEDSNSDSNSEEETQDIHNDAASEEQDSAGRESGSAAGISFCSKLNEAETSEILDIIGDSELDAEEKETAVKEFLNGDAEKIEAVIPAMAEYNRRESDGGETIHLCLDCRIDNDSGKCCSECGGELEEQVEFANRLFKPVGPIKPKKAGSVNNEYFKKESFRDLPSGVYYVEPKYDGVWMEIHRQGDKVKIFSDEKNEHTEKFPGIVNELKKSKTDNFIIVGEMTRWRGRKRLTHEDVTSWLHKKQEAHDDKEFKFKPFDIVMKSGKDVTAQTFDERRKILDNSIKWGKQVHPTAFKKVSHKKGEGRIVAAIEDRKTREGAMVKDSQGKYTVRDQDKLYKWKQQFELDCKVAAAASKDGGGYVYTCEIGRGKDAQEVGKTFATKIEAKVGNIITVSVDSVRYNKDKGTYSWYAPKVIALRKDKKLPDPLSTVKKIAETRGSEPKSRNIISLTEVIPKLKRADIDFAIYLVGGIVENGLTTHDLDILTEVELSEDEIFRIREALGERISEYIDFIVEPNGPQGPHILIIADMAQKNGKWKHANRFVLQRHGWGKKEHWDLRFGAPRQPRMWGYTCFSKPSTSTGGAKSRCQEKKYHDPKWMSVDDKKIPPGSPGNPTKNLNAYMLKEDEGTYKFIRRTPVFLEVVLDGKKYKGRYVFREIAVKPKTDKSYVDYKVDGDEVGTKTDKIWIMWKPKDQEVKTPVKKIAFKFYKGCLTFWESDEIDKEVEG